MSICFDDEFESEKNDDMSCLGFGKLDESENICEF